MRPKSRSGVGWGYLRPVQFLDHLTVIKSHRQIANLGWHFVRLAFCPVGILSTHPLNQLTSSDISLLLRFNILRNGLFCARSESDQPELLNYFVNIFLKSQLRYGLCASVWSQNVGRVHRVSQQLEVRALCIETVRKCSEEISFFFS